MVIIFVDESQFCDVHVWFRANYVKHCIGNVLATQSVLRSHVRGNTRSFEKVRFNFSGT